MTDMELRTLGRGGPSVSAIGLGTNNFGRKLDESAVRGVVDAALDAGITFIDTADIYGGDGQSEVLLGRALGTRRRDVVLASKFGMRMGDDQDRRGASRAWVMRAVEDSLRRLGTDHIDLYQIHEPDPLVPIEETLRALDDLVRQGKVAFVGHSNFAGWQVADAHWTAVTHGLAVPVSEQSHYNLLERAVEQEVLAACRAYGLGFIPYFPLASGLLTGKYGPKSRPANGRIIGTPRESTLLTPRNFALLERLGRFAGDAGHSLLELAFGYLLSQPEVATVISGASSPEQVRQNVESGGWRLTADELAGARAILDADESN